MVRKIFCEAFQVVNKSQIYVHSSVCQSINNLKSHSNGILLHYHNLYCECRFPYANIKQNVYFYLLKAKLLKYNISKQHKTAKLKKSFIIQSFK